MPATMEVGLRQGALPLSPLQPRRLLDIIPRLPAIEDGNPLRWLEGVSWEPMVCGNKLEAEADADCNTTDLGNTPMECEDWITQTPFRLSLAMTRTALDYTLSELGDRLEARFYRELSYAFAAELIGGSNSTFGMHSVATAPAGAAFNAAASPVDLAMEVLEQEIARRLAGTVGYIHCPPGLIGQIVMQIGAYINANGVWETPAGNILISDAGYWAASPPIGGSASSEANDWVYASGPVFFESTAPIHLDAFAGKTGGLNDTTPWNRDTVIQYLQGYGILVFDPCPVTAVLVAY